MTCENCKFWSHRDKLKFHSGTGMAQCSRLKQGVKVGPMSKSTGWLATKSDFGCNLFEAR